MTLPMLSTPYLTAIDHEDRISLYAADNYGDDAEYLDVAEVRQLRDWLTKWLDSR